MKEITIEFNVMFQEFEQFKQLIMTHQMKHASSTELEERTYMQRMCFK